MIEKPTNVVYINIFIAVQIKNESISWIIKLRNEEDHCARDT